MDRIAKNLRRVTLTGRFGTGIVRRTDGAVVPNDEFIDALLAGITEFAQRGVLIGLDPLRLAIAGSQNDDDGADTVVHVLNRIAAALPDSGLVVPSHTTKAQAKDSSDATQADASYATSGSALYSQHARSNFHIGRLSPEKMQKDFPAGIFTPDDIAHQRAVRLTHGRLSHGAESRHRFFRMQGGLLHSITPLAEPTTSEGIRDRYMPALEAVIRRYNEHGEQPSLRALEDEPEVVANIGGRNQLRKVVKRAVAERWIENVGTTKAYRLRLVARGE